MNNSSLVPSTSTQEFKTRVMRRIYALWFWKHVAPLLFVEGLLLGVVLAGVLTHISLRNILLNALQASSGLQAFIQFFIDNFFVKSIQSRLLVLVFGVLAVFFVRDFRSALRRLRFSESEMLASVFVLGSRR